MLFLWPRLRYPRRKNKNQYKFLPSLHRIQYCIFQYSENILRGKGLANPLSPNILGH